MSDDTAMDTDWSTTVGNVKIRVVLSYRGDGRWRAVYWRGEHAVSCSDHPWHAPMPTGPHARYSAEVRADEHARWLACKFGAVANPLSSRVLSMRMLGPIPRLSMTADEAAEIERRVAAEAPERERREAIAMHREAERQYRLDMAGGRYDQYMRELYWRVFRPRIASQEDSHGSE